MTEWNSAEKQSVDTTSKADKLLNPDAFGEVVDQVAAYRDEAERYES